MENLNCCLIVSQNDLELVSLVKRLEQRSQFNHIKARLQEQSDGILRSLNECLKISLAINNPKSGSRSNSRVSDGA
jgi:hypothetical protein